MPIDVKSGSRLQGIAKFLNMKKAFDDAIRQREWEKETLLFADKSSKESAMIGQRGYLARRLLTEGYTPEPTRAEVGSPGWNAKADELMQRGVVMTPESGPVETPADIGGYIATGKQVNWKPPTEKATSMKDMKDKSILAKRVHDMINKQILQRYGYVSDDEYAKLFKGLYPAYKRRFGLTMSADEALGQADDLTSAITEALQNYDEETVREFMINQGYTDEEIESAWPNA